MGADFSRIRSNPLLDFAGVELKQGGVVLDADFNELVAAVDRRIRAAASDIMGRSAVGSLTPDAFKIAAAGGSLTIGKGRLYVDGLLAENHGARSDDPAGQVFDPMLGEPQYTDAVEYTAQPYFPGAPALPESGRHLVYLDVWDREVTHFEHPDLVESAVGVETSSRRQIVWQVGVLGLDAGDATCGSADEDIRGWADLMASSTGRLTTGVFEVPAEQDPCELPPTGGYRGLENQTYRIEIHDPTTAGAAATFKWSRENASVGSRVAAVVSAAELELVSLGRDDVLRFNTGDWVEIVDDRREFSQRAGEMRQIVVDEAARRITFASDLPAEMVPTAFPDSEFPRLRNLRVRRWDQKHKVLRAVGSGGTAMHQDLDDPSSRGVIDVPADGTTLLLENGVSVSFSAAGGKGFRAGDYWVFAARTSDASVEPLLEAPPRGVHHHYARLALWDVAADTVTDCRTHWPPASDGAHDCSCTACVTPESHATGRLTIQDAVNRVSEIGGTVCLAAGRYALREPVRLAKMRSIRIRGQGPATTIVSAGGAFAMRSCVGIAIEDLSIVSLGKQSVITAATVAGLALERLAIQVVTRTGDERGAAISLHGVVSAATIRGNDVDARAGVLANDPVAVPATDEALPAFLIAAALRIEGNMLRCRQQGIALDGTVAHLATTTIAGNEIVAANDVGISATGPAAPGASLAITRNTLNIAGSGIRCALGGAWIEGNKVVTPGGRLPATGIALVTGLDRSGIGQCQVLANQVHGFSRAGILIDVAVRELIVKLNIIEDCGNGILTTGNGNTASVSIENNHLRNIGVSGDAAGAVVAGIGIGRAENATIAGNTIHGVGVKIIRSALCAGIHTAAALRVRVSGNEIADVSPPGDFAGQGGGIVLRAPCREFQVSQNSVQRDEVPTTQPSNGTWRALVGAAVTRENPVSRAGGFASVLLDDARVLVVAPERPHVVTLADAATGAAGPGGRGLVVGNVLVARSTTAVVEIDGLDDCVFNGNQVEQRGNRQVPVVTVVSRTAVLNGNRVQGGGDVAVRLAAAKAAVVGNVTEGKIFAPGPLSSPWQELNIDLHA